MGGGGGDRERNAFPIAYKNVDTLRLIVCFSLQTSKRGIRKRVEPLIMYTHAYPYTSLALMPEEEE